MELTLWRLHGHLLGKKTRSSDSGIIAFGDIERGSFRLSMRSRRLRRPAGRTRVAGNSSTHCARLILPLVVIGIEPGATRTRSATLSPCDFEIAEVTSRLTTSHLSAASSSDSSRCLEFDYRYQLFNTVIPDRYRRATSRADLLDRRLDVVGRVVAPVDNQKVLDTADDE